MFGNSRNRAGAKSGRAIDAVRDGFGKPHFHSGLGIRRLRRNCFECRAGLDLRLAFARTPDA